MQQFVPHGPKAIELAEDIDDIRVKFDYLYEIARNLRRQAEDQMAYITAPLSIEEFIKDEKYLNFAESVYDEVMKALIEANSGQYIEAVFTGGIGTGKTTAALLSQAYQLYRISLLRNPQRYFGIAPADEIVFVFQSLNQQLAKEVDYMRFRGMLDRSPYFRKFFPYDKELKSQLRFPKGLVVKPVSGQDTAAIGQNVISGIIDEVNFMQVVEKSKQKRDGTTYNQAWENYRSIVRRRESRFLNKGKLPGLLCLVSSKQYPGEFTDVKVEESKKNDRIYIYDKRVWEIAPQRFEGVPTFQLFLGDQARTPHLMKEDEIVDEDDAHLVMNVPESYRQSFEDDILAAIRDVAGVSTLAVHPYFTRVEPVNDAFGKLPSIFSRPDVDFETTELKLFPRRFRNPDEPRFVHIDLGLTGDSAGVACGYVSKFKPIEKAGMTEIMPQIDFDFVLEVKPPPQGEISFGRIRRILYMLRERGMNIKWVSLDSYQSADTIQILAEEGFMTGNMSMDTSTSGYDVLKDALVDGRVRLPEHEVALKELTGLERDPKTKKIDHPPHGSKDCSDAIAGVAYGLTMRREVWSRFGISLKDVPQRLRYQSVQDSRSIDSRANERTLFATEG